MVSNDYIVLNLEADALARDELPALVRLDCQVGADRIRQLERLVRLYRLLTETQGEKIRLYEESRVRLLVGSDGLPEKFT